MLLLSSVTCQMGVFAVERGQIKRTRSILHPMSWGLREWYVLSFLMGLYFVSGQGYEYLDLIRNQGLTLSSSAYGSVFYIPTGFHGLHVIGGLIAFVFLLGRTYAAKSFTHEQQVSAIVTAGRLPAGCPASVLLPGLSRDWFETLVAAGARAPLATPEIRLVTAFRLSSWRDRGSPSSPGPLMPSGAATCISRSAEAASPSRAA